MRFVCHVLIVTFYVHDLAAFGLFERPEPAPEAAFAVSAAAATHAARKWPIPRPRLPITPSAAPAMAPAATPALAPAAEPAAPVAPIAPTARAAGPVTEAPTIGDGPFGGLNLGLGSGATATVFPPKRYTRTTGAPNKFTETITTPDWVHWPFVVHIKNGESNGSNRVSSAVILLNGLPVASPLDFNQNVDTIDRPVLLPILTHHLTLYVELRGTPGSYLTISVLGTSGDTHAPTLTITDPPANTTTSDNTPHLAVTYADTDQSDCVASGVDTSTLHVTVDGVDRTSLFTVTNTGAEATIPDSAPLSDGTHVMHAEIKDKAGNIASADRTFNVHTASPQPPTITITSPDEGALVGTSPLMVNGTVTSASAVTVQCATAASMVVATVTGTTWTCAVPLVETTNAINVTATSSGGAAHATRNVTLDTTKPALSITSPLNNTYTAATTVTVSGNVTDEHNITVTVNGTPATITAGQYQATVPVVSAPDFTLQVVARDAVGNQQTASITLHVAQGQLSVHFTKPAPTDVLRGPIIDLAGTTNQDIPVDVDVNGNPATVTNGQFTVKVPVTEGTQTLHATARDAAGRTAYADQTVQIDTIAPIITVTSPALGLITNAANVHITGTVSDASTVTLQLDGQNVTVTNGQFAADSPTLSEGPVTMKLVATDAAGNSFTQDINLVVDRTPPDFTIVSPADGVLVTALPVVVQGTVTDSTNVAIKVNGVDATLTSGAWQASFDGLPDGPRTFTITATDAAGNVTTKSVTATLDTQPPQITITSPAPGTLTRFNVVDVTGTVQDISAVSVTIGDTSVNAAADGTFTLPRVPLSEGDVSIVVTATDAAGHTSHQTIVVTSDTTAPQVDLSTPERITRLQAGQALATVSDANGVAQVVFAVNGAAAATLTTPPFSIPLTVPDGIALGDTFTVQVTATDRAGNVTVVPPRGVRVAADGAIVGQVLSDATGLPIEGATVRIGSNVRTTDAQGRYTVPTEQASMALTVDHDGMTSVSRVVSMASGVGTVPIDARLTPLATAVKLGPDGGSLSTAPSSAIEPVVTVVVPGSLVAADTPFQLTPLSAQGLPELLPLGWSPVSAFDLRSAAVVQSTLDTSVTLTAAQLPTAGTPLALVQYQPLQHAWVVITKGLAPSGAGVIATRVSGLGVFAIVAPDSADPAAVPAENSPLVGVDVVALPTTATAIGQVDPAVIPPTGGTARAELRVDSPDVALPSGTLVQAEINETFALPTGQTASQEQRREDIVLYRAPARDVNGTTGSNSVGAGFPITPSRTFDPVDLIEGHVHLDILAGRESVRGTTGGREAVTVTADDGKLIVPSGALDEDTAVALTHDAFSTFLPTHAALMPLEEFVIDAAGRTLKMPAELSMSASAAAAAGAITGATYVIARVERIDGVPMLSVVALATIQGDRLVATATAGLPGVTQDGRYIFYRVNGDIGFVAGTVSAGGQPVAAVVSGDALPFIARSSLSGDGRYTLATLAGGAAVTVTARVPYTSLQTQGVATVPAAGAIATLDLSLAATVTTATVSPADSARGVAKTTQLTVTTSIPIDPSKLPADAAHLVKVVDTQTTDIPVRVILAGSRQTLSIIPIATLDAGTTYRLDVAGLIDTYGGIVSVPSTTFQTAVDAAPTYSPDALTFSFPDAAGVVTISAPADSFPLGTQFLIINSISGEVVSLSVQNDGSVSGTIHATLNDRLVITITDADGRVTNLTRSQFEDPATGRTAVGTGGGEVKGPGGIALRIPEGALSSAVTLKITPVAEDQFPTKPDVPGAHFGGGLRIESSGPVHFAKEVDVVFPLPKDAADAVAAAGMQPKDAFFYIYRRATADDGQPLMETIDYAKVEGSGDDAKVVTASFPFPGLILLGIDPSYMILMWTFDHLVPSVPAEGVVSGRVLRPRYTATGDVVYDGVANANVELVDAAGNRFDPHLGGKTNNAGVYAILDHRFESSTVQVLVTTESGETARATAFEVQASDSNLLKEPELQTLVGQAIFKRIAHANVTLSVQQSPPSVPVITIRTMKTEGGHRVDTRGLSVTGTPLTIGADAGTYSVRSVTIAREGAQSGEGDSLAVQPDPLWQQTPRDPLAMPVIATELFTPSQAGSYHITVTALPPLGPAVTSSITIRVLADVNHVENDPNSPPSVITAQTVPKADATGVPITLFPQVAFTEPVHDIPGAVFLYDEGGTAVPIKIGGVSEGANGQPVVYDSITSSTTVVTGLTIQPLLGLTYNTRYRLVLTDAIQDLDKSADGTPAEKKLTPYESSFTTFGPSSIGSTEAQFASPGLVLLGDRAYVLETQYQGGVGGVQSGQLRVFDMSDPVQPRELTAPTPIDAAPRDIGGDDHTVVVTTTPHTLFAPGATDTTVDISSGPGNLLVFEAAGNAPQLIGAAALTDNIVDGTPNRVVVKEQMGYVATTRKGLQIVDLSQAKLPADVAGAPPYERTRRLYAPGEGINRQAVITTIPVVDPARPQVASAAWLNDLKVADYTIDTASQRLVLGTGFPAEIGLLIVNPSTTQTLWQGALQTSQGLLGTPDGSLATGQAIALARIGDRDLAIVGGYGTVGSAGASGVIAVVDLSPLEATPQHQSPMVIAWVPLSHPVGDIAVMDNTVIVSAPTGTALSDDGIATLLNLADPFHPTTAGSLTGVGSRVTVAAGILVSTDRTILAGSPDTTSPVRTASLAEAALITKVLPDPIVVAASGEIFTDVELDYRVLPWEPTMTTAEVHIGVVNGTQVANLPGPLADAVGSVVWPKGTIVNTGQSYQATVHVLADGHEVRPLPRRLHLDKIPLALTTRDRLLRIQFALPTQGLFTERKYGVKVYMTTPGGSYPADPAFALTSDQIQNAYPNEDEWWPADPSTAAAESWVTRKIDSMELPPGTDQSIHRQGFEIGAMLAGYPQVKVVVISEDTKRQLAIQEGVVTEDDDWSAILTRIESRVQAAAGMPVADDPVPPPVTFDFAQTFTATSALIYRAAVNLFGFEVKANIELIKGIWDGFVGSLKADGQFVADVYNVLRHPDQLSKKFHEFWSAWTALKDGLSKVSLTAVVQGVLALAKNVHLPPIDIEALLVRGAYFGGYVIGWMIEQVVITVIIGALTFGAGVVARVVTAFVRAGLEVFGLAARLVKILQTALYFFAKLATLVTESRFARGSIELLQSAGELIEKLWTKYPQATELIERLVTTFVNVGADAVLTALKWLTFLPRLVDAAAARIIDFVTTFGASRAEFLMNRWTALTRGPLAVKEAFEAFEQAGKASEGAHDALVLAGMLEHPTSGRTYAADFLAKYGSDAEDTLLQLRRDASDTTFSNSAVSHTLEDLSDPALPKLSKNAVKGAAAAIAKECGL